jgi:hypothetical protein
MDEQQPMTHGPNRGTRKHMGVATSDPDYLSPAPNGRPAMGTGASGNFGTGTGGNRTATPGHPTAYRQRPASAATTPSGQPAQPNYSRYLSTPKKGKAIFTSRQDKQRRRIKVLMAILVLAAIALALVWYFVLR